MITTLDEFEKRQRQNELKKNIKRDKGKRNSSCSKEKIKIEEVKND